MVSFSDRQTGMAEDLLNVVHVCSILRKHAFHVNLPVFQGNSFLQSSTRLTRACCPKRAPRPNPNLEARISND